MPAAETSYVIGVIRELEKGFLEDDEYTRFIDASTPTESLHALVDTPYGEWLQLDRGAAGAFDAFERHLHETLLWLRDVVDDERVLSFISARYDGLNVASALMEKLADKPEPGPLSALGAFPHTVLHSTIWNNLGWDLLPPSWASVIHQELEPASEPVAREALWERVSLQVAAWMEHLAFTPLMHAVLALYRERHGVEEASRPFADESALVSYERDWDKRLWALVQQYRLGPTGYDPILAFWYGKELEVKTLRLLVSSRFVGASSEELRAFQRPLYLSRP